MRTLPWDGLFISLFHSHSIVEDENPTHMYRGYQVISFASEVEINGPFGINKAIY